MIHRYEKEEMGSPSYRKGFYLGRGRWNLTRYRAHSLAPALQKGKERKGGFASSDYKGINRLGKGIVSELTVKVLTKGQGAFNLGKNPFKGGTSEKTLGKGLGNRFARRSIR